VSPWRAYCHAATERLAYSSNQAQEAGGTREGETLQEAENDPGWPVLSEFFCQANQPSPPTEQADRAIFPGGMKLTASAGKANELYDLARDPEEEQDLLRLDDRGATVLAARLNHWVKGVPVRVASSTVDQDPVRRLIALGYA
jgi:hypothetical protein